MFDTLIGDVIESTITSVVNCINVMVQPKGFDLKEYKIIKNFFRCVELKNRKEEYPILLKLQRVEENFIYVFSVPTGLSLNNFLSLKEAIQVQINKPIEITINNGSIEIEVLNKIKEVPKIVIHEQININKYNNNIVIAIGKDKDNNNVNLELKENPHTYIVGTTGSGKKIYLNKFNYWI